MKRGREGQAFTPNSKRHLKSVPATRALVSKRDALAFYQLVKEVYKDNEEVSNGFDKLLRQYKSHSIEVPDLVAKIKVLFKDHYFLILGFCNFLPEGKYYEREVENLPRRPVDIRQAIDYVQQVKVALHNEQPYREFLNILHRYHYGNLTSHNIYEEIAVHLRDYPDLLEGFTCFLPENNVVCCIQQVKPLPSIPQRVESECRKEMEDDFADDERSSQEDNHAKCALCISAEHDPGRGKDKQSSKEKPDGVEHTLLLKNAVDLQVHIGEGRRVFPRSISPRPLIEGGTIKFLQKEVDFLTLVKQKLSKEEGFQKLLNYIYLYSDDLIAREDLDVLVNEVFQECPELIGRFNDFMNECETTELKLLSSRQQGHAREQRKNGDFEHWTCFREGSEKGIDDHLTSVRGKQDKQDNGQKTCSSERNEKGDNDHLTTVRGKHEKQDNDQCRKKVNLERKTEQEKENKKHASRDVLDHKSSHLTNGSKYFSKPVCDLDLSKCEQCTPSYRLLPEDYPLPKVSFRTHLDHAVLNDTWVSVTSGKEAKQKRKNRYEECLFECEEHRFDLDMLLESFRAAIRSVEEIFEEVMDPDIQGVDIVDFLTANSSRCVELIYAEHGLDILDSLRQNPVLALPVILDRLKQKHDESLKYQADMNKIWAEVFVKNYYKSLDHRSLYFKQQDQKNVSTKAFLAEIKERNAIKRKSDNFILSLASGNPGPIMPDLRLEYPDAGINNDLYQILKHSVKVLLPKTDELAKVLHVWKIFLEPLCQSFQEKSQDIVTSRNITSSNGEIETRRQDVSEAHGLQTSETQVDVGRQCSRFTNDNIDSSIAKFMSVDDCIDDVNRLEYLKRKEIKEGKSSPSQDALQMHNLNGKFMKTANINLLDFVTEHCSSYHVGKEGKKTDQSEENGIFAKELDDNEQACTQQLGEVSKNDASESGDNMSCSEAGDQGANHEDKEQIINDGDVEENAAFGGIGLVNEDRVLQRCRPLFLKGTNANFCEGNSVIFYGNDNMYILLRLHQELHQRIHMAKVNAVGIERKLREETYNSSSDLYDKFLHAMYRFLDGTADSTEFEDVCRSIGGNKFYLFLDMDKLIFKLVKQLQVVASDEMAMKLLALHDYEQSPSPSGLRDVVYHANASMLLGTENVYKFEQRFEAGQVFVELMEGPLEIGEALPSTMPLTFAKNLLKFLLSDPLERSQRDPLFLKRNTQSCPLDDVQRGVQKDVLIVNGLELNMSYNSYKVTYKFNTEDFLYRRKCNSRKSDCVKPHNALGKASFKFHRWLNNQI